MTGDMHDCENVDAKKREDPRFLLLLLLLPPVLLIIERKKVGKEKEKLLHFSFHDVVNQLTRPMAPLSGSSSIPFPFFSVK